MLGTFLLVLVAAGGGDDEPCLSWCDQPLGSSRGTGADGYGDEVTSALDPELVAGVLGVLRDIASSTDITMLLVTLEMRFAQDIADRVLMLDAVR